MKLVRLLLVIGAFLMVSSCQNSPDASGVFNLLPQPQKFEITGDSPIQAAQMMVRHDIGRLPVVEDGRIIGIITRSDVMMYFYDLLPDCPQSKN